MSSEQDQKGDGRSQETWTPDDMQASRIVVDSMTCSPTIGKIATALGKAQRLFGTVAKDKEAEVKKGGVFQYKYTYADLASSIAATREALLNNGITVVQTPAMDRGWVTVTTLFAHESGEWIAGSLSMSAGQDGRPQAVGSAITYARRYALQAMTGLATVDDDGAAAQKDAEEKPATQPAPKRKPPDYATLKREVWDLLQRAVEHTARTQEELMADVGIEKSKKPTKTTLAAAKNTLLAFLDIPSADRSETSQADLDEAAQKTLGDDHPAF